MSTDEVVQHEGGVGAASLTWDEDGAHWVVARTDGGTTTARFVVAATGGLTVPKTPEFPGQDRFRGEYLTTRDWPREPVSFEGKRVGVIGTGASGIQVIQEIARTAGELTVFQRSPNFATPMHNRTYPAQERAWNSRNAATLWSTVSPVSGLDVGRARPSVFADTPEQVRAHLAHIYDEEGGFSMALASYADALIDPRANAVVADFIRDRIRERVYDPAVAELLCPTDHAPPRPVVVVHHGGGFVSGDLGALDHPSRHLAADLDAVVVSVDYRLAPEHPFPAAVHDARAALAWTRENIHAHGGDPERIAVLGESAGANLAAVVARHAATDGVPLAAQVLLYPVADGEVDTPSKREFFHGPFLTVPAGDRFWTMYLAGQPVTVDAAPLRATPAELARAAPALVLTMGLDPLRDEGERYAQLLREAGCACSTGASTGSCTGPTGSAP